MNELVMQSTRYAQPIHGQWYIIVPTYIDVANSYYSHFHLIAQYVGEGRDPSLRQDRAHFYVRHVKGGFARLYLEDQSYWFAPYNPHIRIDVGSKGSTL